MKIDISIVELKRKVLPIKLSALSGRYLKDTIAREIECLKKDLDTWVIKDSLHRPMPWWQVFKGFRLVSYGELPFVEEEK